MPEEHIVRFYLQDSDSPMPAFEWSGNFGLTWEPAEVLEIRPYDNCWEAVVRTEDGHVRATNIIEPPPVSDYSNVMSVPGGESIPPPGKQQVVPEPALGLALGVLALFAMGRRRAG